MKFNKHSELAGSHAFLSPSSYHWINYTEEKLENRFLTAMAAARGTELHEFASQAIKLGIRLKGMKTTIGMFVNDCISDSMVSEQILFVSPNAFGTADAIKLKPATRGRKPKLLIFDLKTGVTETNFKQLEVYAAYFCLEYGFKPGELDYELRIYQSDEVRVHIPEVDDILHIMDKTITFDKIIMRMKDEVNV